MTLARDSSVKEDYENKKMKISISSDGHSDSS